MKDTTQIGELYPSSGFGISGSNSYKTTSTPLQAKPQVSKLRTGEIIQGTILESYPEQTALVRLPIGDLRAVLTGKLNKGDTLFFKVMQTSPGLVLRVYSLNSVVNGEVLSPDTILRILNLPITPLSLRLAEYLSNRNLILQDEAATMLRCLIKIHPDLVEETDIDTTFSALSIINSLGVEPNEKLIRKLLPALKNSRQLDGLLTKLLEAIASGDTSSNNAAAEQIYRLDETHPAHSKILLLLPTISSFRGSPTFNAIDECLRSLSVSYLHASYAKQLLNAFESVLYSSHLLNFLSEIFGTNQYYFALIIYRGRILLRRIINDRKNEHKRKKNNRLLGKEFNIDLFIDDEDIDENYAIEPQQAQLLEEYSKAVKLSVAKRDNDYKKLMDGFFGKGIIDIPEEPLGRTRQGVSVVV
jgi:hypothetical protein